MTCDWRMLVPAFKHNFVLRRAQWVIEEARSKGGYYDQAIARLLRVLSNFATFGEDISSEGVKRRNLRMTEAAYADLVSDLDFKRWHKVTTNEHQKELSYLFAEMQDDFGTNRKTWTPDDLMTDLNRWPMTTMLKKPEANCLPKKSSPEHRYFGIKLATSLMQTPWHMTRNKK